MKNASVLDTDAHKEKTAPMASLATFLKAGKQHVRPSHGSSCAAEPLLYVAAELNAECVWGEGIKAAAHLVLCSSGGPLTPCRLPMTVEVSMRK